MAALVAAISIAFVFGTGMLNANDPTATILAVYPSNLSVVNNDQPQISVSLTLHDADSNLLNFSLYLDGEATPASLVKNPYGVQFTLSQPLSEGLHGARVEIAYAQKILACPAWNFSIDVSAPGVTNLDPVNGSAQTGEGLVVVANYSDQNGVDVSSVILLLDGTDITSASQRLQNGVSYAPFTPLGEGTHNFTIVLSDTVNNTGSYSWFLTITHPVEGSTPPYLIAFSPANNSLINTPAPLVWFYFNDTDADFDANSTAFRMSYVVPFNCIGSPSSGWNISYLGYYMDGNYSASITVKDYSNNVKSERILFTVDATAPSVSAATPSNGAVLSSNVTSISARFSDFMTGVDPSSVMIKLDYEDITQIAQITGSGFNYTAALQDGTHSVLLRVSDFAGNVARVNWTFNVNTTSPDTGLTGSVSILTKTGYYNTESGLPTIIGEVKNTGNTSVKNVLVQGLFLCNDGNVINNDEEYPAIAYAYAVIDLLEPGEVSPFKIVLPSDFPDFSYILSQLKKFDANVVNFTVTNETTSNDYQFTNITYAIVDGNHYNLTGVITNNGSVALSNIKIVGTFYSSNRPIAVEYAFVYSLAPGEQAYFTLMVEDDDVALLITRYELKGSL